MAKKNREIEVDDLNLVPIMNLVLILIPLLLLSIVFLQIAVINVTMPQPSMGKPQNDDKEPPLRLRAIVNKEGFILFKGEAQLPAIPGCEGQNVTICLSDPSHEMDVMKYNWMALYNELLKIKQEQKWAEHQTLEVVAGAEITFDILIKAMDVSRNQLTKPGGATQDVPAEFFSDVLQFNSALMIREQVTTDEGEGLQPKALFPLVVLGMPVTE